MLTTSYTLLDQLREPDASDAWKQFVNLYSPLIVVWALRQGLDGTDANDLAREVLVKLVRLLPTYEPQPGVGFREWLFSRCAEQYTEYDRRRGRPAGPERARDLDDDEYRRLLIRRGLELARPDFNDFTWLAFTRVVVDRRPVEAVAAELGASANAVYLAQHRVLARLRQELNGMLE